MEEIKKTFLEEYEGAEEQLNKGRYKNAAILSSKALFALCDFLIYSKLSKLPKNHTERFRILEEYFPEIYENNCYDFIRSGGSSVYLAEMLNSAKFVSLLKVLEKDYSVIIVTIDGKASDVETSILMNVCAGIVISVQHETIKELENALEGKKNRAFLVIS